MRQPVIVWKSKLDYVTPLLKILPWLLSLLELKKQTKTQPSHWPQGIWPLASYVISHLVNVYPSDCTGGHTCSSNVRSLLKYHLLRGGSLPTLIRNNHPCSHLLSPNPVFCVMIGLSPPLAVHSRRMEITLLLAITSPAQCLVHSLYLINVLSECVQ